MELRCYAGESCFWFSWYLIYLKTGFFPSSLSDLKNRSEKATARVRILTISGGEGYSIDRKSGEIWIGQTLLQRISFKSDGLLDPVVERGGASGFWGAELDATTSNGHSIPRSYNAALCRKIYFAYSLRVSPPAPSTDVPSSRKNNYSSSQQVEFFSCYSQCPVTDWSCGMKTMLNP